MESESIVQLNINSSSNYVNLIKSMYMFIFIFMVWHVLLSLSYDKKQPINIGLTGELFNNNFINFILTGMISILSFYLVFQKILEIN
jgi:uncharacterized oligopeptide transporter (OPT) family protein|tara:strand:- start:678 stop:938 length:261 start_codon:yes stop_codon:yes gene_type:complete